MSKYVSSEVRSKSWIPMYILFKKQLTCTLLVNVKFDSVHLFMIQPILYSMQYISLSCNLQITSQMIYNLNYIMAMVFKSVLNDVHFAFLWQNLTIVTFHNAWWSSIFLSFLPYGIIACSRIFEKDLQMAATAKPINILIHTHNSCINFVQYISKCYITFNIWLPTYVPVY